MVCRSPLPGVGKPAMVVVRVPMLGFWLKGIKKFLLEKCNPTVTARVLSNGLDSGQ